MIGIIERVQEIFVEWMYVLEAGKAIEDDLKFLAESFGGELDFSSIEAYETPCQYLRGLDEQIGGRPRIRLILKPDLICVGRRRCVRLRTISMNS
jgi:hypothetical protein